MFVRSRFIVACLFLLATVVSGRAIAAVPEVPRDVRELMQDRKYDEAVAAIDALLKQKKDDLPRDYLGYLKGRALHLADKYEQAIVAYDTMAKSFPESPWVRRARLAKGVSFARKGDFRAAELAYRAEAEFLLSLDRKQEIAEIYLEFADAFSNPPQFVVERVRHQPLAQLGNVDFALGGSHCSQCTSIVDSVSIGKCGQSVIRLHSFSISSRR